MADYTSSNKRLAKNTLLLYIRMFIMMSIGFITSRYILQALGVEDYGIQNVVGGLVSMFSLMSTALSASAGRFITYGIGKGDSEYLRRIFSTSINIHFILAILVIIAIESIGVWFLNHRLTIAPNRLIAANWVLQCSVVTFATGLSSVSYNAAIIAHEKMSTYAYLSLFEAAYKLVIVYILCNYTGDRLILISIFFMFSTIITSFVYYIYCKRHFEECNYQFIWDKSVFSEMSSFAGWNFIGTSAALMNNQGVNIAINLFTNPTINAARGIAMQANGIVSQFTNNFMTALRPQIIKDYSQGNLEHMHQLIFQGARFSYYLFMLLSVPLIFETDTILMIWLGQIPEHTVLFLRLVLVLSLSDLLSNTLIIGQAATGKIRNYQIVVGGLLALNFPISYLFLKFHFFPEITIIIAIVISQVCLFARLLFLRRMISLSMTSFLKKVYFNVLPVTFLSLPLPYCLLYFLEPGFIRLCIVAFCYIVSSLIMIYFLGLNKGERQLMMNLASKYIKKFQR